MAISIKQRDNPLAACGVGLGHLPVPVHALSQKLLELTDLLVHIRRARHQRFGGFADFFRRLDRSEELPGMRHHIRNQ